MRRRYLFTHYTTKGYACLEDESGGSFSVPTEWLPEAAAPGAILDLCGMTSFESAHFSITVKDAFTKTQVPPDTLNTSPKEN
jgi:hypothetical protein